MAGGNAPVKGILIDGVVIEDSLLVQREWEMSALVRDRLCLHANMSQSLPRISQMVDESWGFSISRDGNRR